MVMTGAGFGPAMDAMDGMAPWTSVVGGIFFSVSATGKGFFFILIDYASSTVGQTVEQTVEQTVD
jgi:hypothetical protein